MKVGVWVAVCLLAVNVGLNAYGLVKPMLELPPQPRIGSAMGEVAEMSRLRKDRALGQLAPSDVALLELLERRDAERRLEFIQAGVRGSASLPPASR